MAQLAETVSINIYSETNAKINTHAFFLAIILVVSHIFLGLIEWFYGWFFCIVFHRSAAGVNLFTHG